MAGEERSPGASVAELEALASKGSRLGFFALLSLLERALKTRLGENVLADERIRLRHDNALTFSASDITRLEVLRQKPDPDSPWSHAQEKVEVTTAFLGLTGSSTPLPFYMAEEVAQEDPDRPHRREFLDLFHHRLLSLLYRAVSTFSVDRGFQPEGNDAWSRRLLALCGFDAYAPELPEASIPVFKLLRLSSLLATFGRTARGLELALYDILAPDLEGAHIHVHPFAGKWVALDEADQMRLGRVNSELSRNAVVGKRMFDRSGNFEIEFQGVTRKLYKRLLPSGDLCEKVHQTVQLFTRDPLDFRMWAILVKGAAIPFQPSARGGEGRLGLDVWLGDRRNEETRVEVRTES